MIPKSVLHNIPHGTWHQRKNARILIVVNLEAIIPSEQFE